MTEKEKLIDKVHKDILARKPFEIVMGAFGDVEGCEGYVEEKITPPKVKEGRFSKWYGCTYLFKGIPDGAIVEGIGFGKAFLSILPREMIEPVFETKLYLLYLYLFRRKVFYHSLRTYVNVVCTQLVDKIGLPENQYNTLTRELKRAIKKVLVKEYKRIWNLPEDSIVEGVTIGNADPKTFRRHEFLSAIWNLTRFSALFIEHDNAYRFPLQDAFEIIEKEEIEKSVVKEINRVFEVVISRSDHIKMKMTSLRRMVLLALIVSPWLRNFVKDVIRELDFEKLKLDRSDWYFCLNRKGYQYRGIPYEKRLEIRKKIDKEKGHYRLVVYNISVPGNPDRKGFNVVPFSEAVKDQKNSAMVS